MQLTSAICVVILSATVSVSAIPTKWEYGACDFGRRIGCSFGYKRDAAPAPAPIAEPVVSESSPNLLDSRANDFLGRGKYISSQAQRV